MQAWRVFPELPSSWNKWDRHFLYSQDAIAGALVANSLLKAMKQKTEDTELAIKMQEYIE